VIDKEILGLKLVAVACVIDSDFLSLCNMQSTVIFLKSAVQKLLPVLNYVAVFEDLYHYITQ